MTKKSYSVFNKNSEDILRSLGSTRYDFTYARNITMKHSPVGLRFMLTENSAESDQMEYKNMEPSRYYSNIKVTNQTMIPFKPGKSS